MNDYRAMPTAQTRPEVMSAFMRGVYGWMSAGLGLTTITALYVSSSQTIMQALVSQPMLPIILFIAQLGLVVWLSAGLRKMSASTATMVFLGYSALTGVTFSFIFLIYTMASIFKTFLVTAGMFGAMSIYGMVTKKDLTSWGSFLFMGLIGIVIAMVVNMFMHSPAMDFAISFIGVIIFTGLTAYDTQQLKTMGEMAPANDSEAVRKATIFGALRLYLDFINLFLMLLRFFGASRN